MILDRLGSVRYRKQGSTTERLDHWPYGEEKPGETTQNRGKFATYFRDATGLDYADQRYFNSQHGRFLTPDPLIKSWSLYEYANDDPINNFDPNGLQSITVTAPMPPGLDPLHQVVEAYNLWYRRQQGNNDIVVNGSDEFDINRQGAVALSVREEVREGRMTDCEGLAVYAFDTAAYQGSFQGNFDWRNQFVGSFGTFVDANHWLVGAYNDWVFRFGSFVGITQPIVGVPGTPNLLPPGQASGFQPQFQDSGEGPPADQAHHFAAFFQIGYSAGAAVGIAAGVVIDAVPLNPGDIRLGIAAANLGARLKKGEVNTLAVAGEIRRLCQ